MKRWIKSGGWLEDGVCDQRVWGQTYDGCEQGRGERYLWRELGQRKRASTVDGRCSLRRHRLLTLCPSVSVACDEDRQPPSRGLPTFRHAVAFLVPHPPWSIFAFPSSKSLLESPCKEAQGQHLLPTDPQAPQLPGYIRSTHRLKSSTQFMDAYFVLLISGDACPLSMTWRGMLMRLP